MNLDSELQLVRDNLLIGSDSQELPEEVATILKTKGYFSLLLPAQLRGNPVPYPDYVSLIMSFAEVDASTAWCINQGSVLASLARLVDEETASSIWSGPEVVLANGPPAGSCTSTETNNAFELTGNWNFSSGIAHADWLVGLAMTKMRDDSKAPLMHLIPKQEVTIDETWDVNGLRQTGSFSFSTNNLAVPSNRVFAYEIRDDDPPIYQIPLNLLFAGGFAAVALGTSRAAIDYAIERCKTKIKRFHRESMQHDTATQDVLGHAEAIWHAARSFLLTTIDNVWKELQAENSCNTDAKYSLRLATTHAIREAKTATDLVYDLCSTDSIQRTEQINRCFQDVHVISQHLQGRPEVYAIFGQHKLGLPVDSFLVD